MKRRDSKIGEGWVSGRFLPQHHACFDSAGNRCVAEQVRTERLTNRRKGS
jgi:hypothetical protein